MIYIVEILVKFKEFFAILIGGVVAYFLIKQDQKNEDRNQQLQEKIDEIKRTERDQNNFNNLDDVEQSNWMLNDLEEKRDKLPK